MTRKILINGRREEELRVAIVENQTLEDFEIETKHSGLLRNNIYRGVVSSIAPSLNAAFVDFGEAKNGFLAFNDVVESVYCKHVKDTCRIADVLSVGQELIVQVIKDAGGLKGAQVTTNISIAGRYLVLRPKDAKSGVSRKVDDDARADLTQKIRSLDLPEGYGCIVRTNAMDQSRAILLRDARVLVQLWHKIEAEFARGKGPQLLYNDQDIVVQAMRDYFDATINEVLIDDKSCFERAKAYVRATFENGEDKLKFYGEKMPLFTRYGIEKQIEQIYARTVWLPSGGFIVIDPTEALTAIDVNSAHSTKRESQDLTAYHTNLEAAVEIARQLRMRDIGGLIVIDFIDMRQGKQQRDVERVMRTAMARDKARSKVERISANGLLEINRQRLSQALSMRTHLECPTCGGRGFIPSAEAIGMTLIREIDARAVNGELGGVIIKLHPDIAQQLQNERRREFAQLELDYGIRIEIVGARDISRGDEQLEWLTKRQESELHPERVVSPAQEAASIIDVAEVYKSDENDETYRPNDFEEFSSDEARKRRAEKRAARREAAKNVETDVCKCAEINEIKVEETCKPCEEIQREIVKPQTKEAKETKKVTNAHSQTGLAILGILISQMKEYLVDAVPTETGRSHRFGFRNRRHANKSETGIQSDLRMFAMDILKAVCITACGCTTDVSRREMLDRQIEASDWLVGSSQSTAEAAVHAANAIRNQITSRHATIRLACLFDAASVSQPDEICRLLLDIRKEAFNDEEKITENRLRSLNRHLAYRISDIFVQKEEAAETEEVQSVEVEAKAPSSEPVIRKGKLESALSDVDMDELREVLEKEPERVVKEEPAFSGAVLATDSVSSEPRQRMRGRRRAAIGENKDIFISKDAVVVTSDILIAPMKIEADVQNDIEEAITQEIPAVKPLRRVRRTRVVREDVEQKVPAVSAPVQVVAPVQQVIENVAKVENVPEKVSEAVSVKAESETASDGVGSRRVRRTRRNHPDMRQECDIDTAENVSVTRTEKTRRVEVSPELKGGAMVEVTPEMEAVAVVETAPVVAPVVEAAPVVAPVVESVAEAISDEENSTRTRRVRRTRRSMMGTAEEAAPVEVAVAPVEVAVAPVEVAVAPVEVAVAPVEVVVAPVEVAVAPVEVAVAPVEVAVAPVEVAVAPVEVAEIPVDAADSGRRTRRTRSTRVRRINDEQSEAKTDVQSLDETVKPEVSCVPREVELAAAPVEVAAAPVEVVATPKLDAVELLNASRGESNRSTRRVRKTRPAKLAENKADEKLATEVADTNNEKTVEQLADEFDSAVQEFSNIMSEVVSDYGNAAQVEEEQAVLTADEFRKSADEFQAEASEFKKIMDGLRNDEIAPVRQEISSDKPRENSTRRVRRTRRFNADQVSNEVKEVKASEPLLNEVKEVKASEPLSNEVKEVKASEPQVVVEPVKTEVAMETVEPVEKSEQIERTRTRRTRRTRPEEV